MRRCLWVICFAWLLSLGYVQESHAGFGIALSGGANYDLLVNDPKQSKRLGVNTELLLSYEFLMLSADLGLHYDFMKGRMLVRPGMRLLLGFFYLRVAVPLAFAVPPDPGDAFKLGALLGAGVRLTWKKWSFFLEASLCPFFVNFNNDGVLMPAEGRLGVGYHF